MTDADATSFIPFNRLSLMGSEEEHVLDALRSGHVSGDGAYTKKCKAWFEERLGVPSALLTTSCTHALEMSAILLNIQPGDEVIIPSFTFVSTVNAFVLRGARPVFADIRPDTLNMDESLLEGLKSRPSKTLIIGVGVGAATAVVLDMLEADGGKGEPAEEGDGAFTWLIVIGSGLLAALLYLFLRHKGILS